MLTDLYYGRVSPWERKNRRVDEQRKLVGKIEAEERYFMEKMSGSDCQRFQELSKLYSELSISSESDIFAKGFSLGLLIMADVMDEKDRMLLGQSRE